MTEYPGDWPDDMDGDPEDGDDQPDAGETGALGGEVLRLVALVQDWARRTFPEAPDSHTGSDCQWCPLCQFAAVLRGERPEVTERVAEAGSAVASALRALLDTTAAGGGAPAGQHRSADPTGAARVQRIDLGPGD